MAKSLGEIANLLQHTKFKRKWFGGVDEDDVWKKIERLQAEYSELIEENSYKHDALIDQWSEYTVSLEKQLQKRGGLPQSLPANPKGHTKASIDSMRNQGYERG